MLYLFKEREFRFLFGLSFAFCTILIFALPGYADTELQPGSRVSESEKIEDPAAESLLPMEVIYSDCDDAAEKIKKYTAVYEVAHQSYFEGEQCDTILFIVKGNLCRSLEETMAYASAQIHQNSKLLTLCHELYGYFPS